MGTVVDNHCASCGRTIEPEEEFCPECLLVQEPCPMCGRVICECDVPEGD